jgi:hypothetical protein
MVELRWLSTRGVTVKHAAAPLGGCCLMRMHGNADITKVGASRYEEVPWTLGKRETDVAVMMQRRRWCVGVG